MFPLVMYATWTSGFFLLVWVYYLGADLYLIDPAIRTLTPLSAAAIGLASALFICGLTAVYNRYATTVDPHAT
jgi:uncharacterized membrane protein